MSSRTKSLVSIAACLVVLTSCGSKSDSDNAATGSTPTSEVATTTDPYAVPAVIDAAYINRVLAAIEHVRGDVRREVYATQQYSEATNNKLADIYDGPILPGVRKVFSDASMGSNDDALKNPGDEVVTVDKIRVARQDCVVVEVTNDNSAVVKVPVRGRRVMALWTVPGNHNSNPTPWKIEVDSAAGDVGSDYAC